MARAKKEDTPPAGAPAWMTTYGDMMTLLMTFFVLIVSFSTMQEAGFKAAIGSLQGALGILSDTAGEAVIGQIVQPVNVYAFLANRPRQTTGRISKDLNFLADVKGAYIKYDERGMHIVLPAEVLFDSGSAMLSSSANDILRRVGAFLYENNAQFIIEGHTDNRPVNSPFFASNWELSAARATAVMKFFNEKCGLPYDRMSMAGYAEYHPVASNDTAEGRRKNRRVEIVVQGEEIKRKYYDNR